MPEFLFGAATSAHQVEGDNHNDWTQWEQRGGHEQSGRACDHYNRYEEDFDIAKDLGHNAHRFSVEWSRIEPEAGVFNEREISHYRNVLAALEKRGLEPFITLWHFTNPAWFSQRGGWLDADAPELFARYAVHIVKSLGDGARYYLTINEPNIYALNGYLRGTWPPQHKGFGNYLRVLNNLARAHRLAYAAIKGVCPAAQIGYAHNMTFFDGWAAPLARWWNNHRFLRRTQDRLDFIGLNYYFHNRIRGFRLNQNENKSVSDMGWEIYPEGIYRVLRELKRYGKPVFVTENGIADANDAKRTGFIRDHLRWVRKAMDEGVDVRGYFYWSLMDNFEWDKGFAPRFGLVEMDYKTLVRKIRPSAREYKQMIESFKQ